MTAEKSRSYKAIALFSAITISLPYVACCISLLCFSTLVLIADISQVFAHPTIDKNETSYSILSVLKLQESSQSNVLTTQWLQAVLLGRVIQDPCTLISFASVSVHLIFDL